LTAVVWCAGILRYKSRKAMSLGQLLQATANRLGGKTALICGDEVVSYQELDRVSRALARRLLRDGLRPGDRVAVHSANSVNTVKLVLACFHAGLIGVPVNIRLKAPEVAHILGHAQPVLCFSQPALAPVAQAACQEGSLRTEVRTQLPDGLETGDLPAVDAAHPALIMYTSGTTARPKGVTHSHASVLGMARTVMTAGVGEDGTMLVAVPLMHSTGLTSSTLPSLLAGATVVLLPAFDPAAVLDHVERYRCTWGLGLPAMMQLVAAEQERQPRDVSSVRQWLAGGDTVPVALQERFQRLFGIPLQEGYAMTESLVITWNRADAIRPGSIGAVADLVEARAVSPTGEPVRDGEIGEMAVRSPANFIGYWEDPAATAGALQDGWLLTGDLVRRDSEGYFWFAGRLKEIIIRGGSNISPQEVEEALYRHPAVMEVGVIGMPDPVYNEQVVACVSLRDGRRAEEQELRDFARERLADYKVPERIVFLPQLPKGLTGKVQRRALKQMAANAGQAGTS
jgi:long-chain acyl-CoA synthetase